MAALAIVAGFSTIAWSQLAVRDHSPTQDKTIVTPVKSNSPTPSNQPAHYLKHPKVGDKIGTITFPTLKLSWPIFEGTTQKQLARGAGHYVSSVLPGLRDNTIISGHRTTVFNKLGKLHKGDLIYVRTSAGLFTYKMRSFWIVMRSNTHVIRHTKTAVLTLTTCYPFNNLDRTVKAYIVTADQIASNLSAK